MRGTVLSTVVKANEAEQPTHRKPEEEPPVTEKIVSPIAPE